MVSFGLHNKRSAEIVIRKCHDKKRAQPKVSHSIEIVNRNRLSYLFNGLIELGSKRRLGLEVVSAGCIALLFLLLGDNIICPAAILHHMIMKEQPFDHKGLRHECGIDICTGVEMKNRGIDCDGESFCGGLII